MVAKKYYLLAFTLLLILVVVTFIYQVKHFSSGKNDWLYLGLIVLAGLGSYLISRKMREEKWFEEQSKRNK